MTLYATELGVNDWPAALAWYVGVLGLPEILVDRDTQYALLGGEGGRLVLLGGKKVGGLSGRHRLVFHVEDIEATRLRLIEAGVSADEIYAHLGENYRAFRITGPEGTPIKVFAWGVGEASG